MDKIAFTRIKPDTNGNGRLVCSWLAIPGAGSYAEAVKLAHKIGGRKYHTKSYGGGIVFQASSETQLQHEIESLDTRPVFYTVICYCNTEVEVEDGCTATCGNCGTELDDRGVEL